MLHLSPQCRYYLYQGSCDMRKGFDGLAAQKILGFFADVFEWVRDTFTDDQARAALLADLGLPTDSPAKLEIPKDKVDSLQRYRANADVDMAAFVQTLEDLKVIIEAVKAFVEAAGVSGEAAIEEYSHRVFHILSLNYVRMHQPGLFGGECGGGMTTQFNCNVRGGDFR